MGAPPPQGSLEAVNFLLELPDELLVGVFVHHRLVLDLLGAVGVAQRGHRLVVVHAGRGHSSNHDGLGVATQRVLQQHGEHGITVRDTGLLLGAGVGVLGQGGNAVTQGGQRQVDGSSLLEAVAAGACGLLALRAGEVDQVDEGGLVGCLHALSVHLGLAQSDLEDGVRATGGSVHVGGGHGAGGRADLHELLNLLVVQHFGGSQVIHVETLLGVVTDFQVMAVLGVEKITNLH